MFGSTGHGSLIYIVRNAKYLTSLDSADFWTVIVIVQPEDLTCYAQNVKTKLN